MFWQNQKVNLMKQNQRTRKNLQRKVLSTEYLMKNAKSIAVLEVNASVFSSCFSVAFP